MGADIPERSGPRRHGLYQDVVAYSVAPTGFDILKPSDFEAGIFSGAPVDGLRPSRAGRSLTEKRPNPAMETSSPRLAASIIDVKMELTTCLALAFERSLASAMASMSPSYSTDYPSRTERELRSTRRRSSSSSGRDANIGTD